MTYKLHRNGVITGSLNSFCLTCELFLNCKEEADGHIETLEHIKKLHAVPYSDKFKLEHIKKFKRGYYCEFCNVLMPIASKVNVHITEDEHKHNKGILLLAPMGDFVVVFNDTFIKDKAWHGLIKGVCSLCNAEFEDENDHKADTSHSLNLVLKPIQFGADNAIFRHLDDTAVQCLTCNKLLAPGRLIKHFEETEHHELYAKCRNRIDDFETKENCQEIEAKATSQGNEAQEKAINVTSAIKNDDELKTLKIENGHDKEEKKPTKDKSKILESDFETKENCQEIEAKATSQGNEAQEKATNITSAIKNDDELKTLKIENGHDKEEKKPTKDKSKILESDFETKENCQKIEAKATSQGNEAQEKATNITSAIKNDDELKTLKIENGHNKEEKKPTKDKSKILESIAKYQSKGININLETETAFCKKCSKPVACDFQEIENHMENHSAAAADSDLLYPSTLDHNLNRVDINDKTTKSSDGKENTENVSDFIKACRDKVQEDTSHDENNVSNGEDTDSDSTCPSDYIPPVKDFEKCSQEEEAGKFAKANKITFNSGNNRPASFRSMKEHVDGANHKKHAGYTCTVTVTKPKSPRNVVKMSTKEFIDSSYTIQGLLYTATVLNEKFCILKNSFLLISSIGSRMRCILCEVNVSPLLDIEDHYRSRQHLMKWLEVPVITSETDEIIREVRPGLFHCGYCNLVVSGWSDMKQHLGCSDHRENKITWTRRLMFHLPDVRRFRLQRQMEAICMMNFFHNMFN